MSGGGGGSGNDGSNDMQVSGYEAAMSTEKGISTHSDSRTSSGSYNDKSNTGNNDRPNPHTVSGTSKADLSLGPDRSTVGIAADDPPTDSEIEKGYTDDGQKLSNINGTYMTKSQMFNKGIIEKDPNTGEEVMGRNTINPNTGELERTDLTFSEHWSNAPDALKFSPTMRFLYATGKNIGEWSNKKGFQGYNEAGLRGKLGNASNLDGSNSTTNNSNFLGLSGDGESDRMKSIAPQAPYIVSGITPPSNSPAANWYGNLGTTSTNNSNNIGLQYANAKQAVAKTLSNNGALGMLAVNDSPYYDWLKTKNLDRGIL
tara:strand:+ start:48 stop:992 length:945 start_codon:yes stop_codon:yes gene_type:complete